MAQNAQPASSGVAWTEQERLTAAFWEPLNRQMVNWTGVRPGLRVLDAGCGSGDHVVLFAELLGQCGEVVAVDRRQEALQKVAARCRDMPWEARVQLQLADFRQLPYPKWHFDIVWVSHALHHLPDIDAHVKELRRVVRPGGRLFIREDRPNIRVLPDDVGLSAPGLENRVLQVFVRWLEHDRLQRGRYPYGWLHALRQAGIDRPQVRSFLYELSAPFTGSQQAFLRLYLRRRAEMDGVDPADRSALLRLTDPQDQHHMFSRDDLHFTSLSTIYWGQA
jgi:SAM-dependent methyltransferase